MACVTISSKSEVVIPRSIRERLHPAPGQPVWAMAYGDRIEYIPKHVLRRNTGNRQAGLYGQEEA